MDTESIKDQIVSCRYHHHHHHSSSHGDRAPPFYRTVPPNSSLFSFPLALRRRITPPHLVDARVRDRPRALVCKSSKRKRLAHLENFVSVHLVLEQWIPRCVRWRAVRRCKRLR